MSVFRSSTRVADRVRRLNLELTDASRFQDAYYKLLDETEGLLARNDLAEEEAERLSRFNAQILGHHNPAQRIAYVDRIRKELADTKQVRTAINHPLSARSQSISGWAPETACVRAGA